MSTVVTPPPRKINRIGLEILNYKGGKTTRCAGCGHNSISERIIECESPAYFLNSSHGFNAAHGRMPAIATGAILANRNILGIGVSGDGDTAFLRTRG